MREKTGIDLLEHVGSGIRLEASSTDLAAARATEGIPAASQVAGLQIVSATRVIVLRDE
jgi:hypothetical protein